MRFVKNATAGTRQMEDTGHYLKVEKEFKYSIRAESPGADVTYLVKPQKAKLFNDGYQVQAELKGIVVGRGYYGGSEGSEEVFTYTAYSYQAELWLEGKEKSAYPIKIVKK